jgi:pimeloyl-ACP methyl ester carboxylesterase
MRIHGFAYHRVDVTDASLLAAVGGEGPAVLLLHGFPESHLAWRHVAAELADRHTVVCADLRGYGGSRAPAGADYSKRTMAVDAVDLMAALGLRRFAVAGHDRGALVAFRAALDHPATITHLCAIGVIPTIDMWESMRGVASVAAWHLPFLAQPGDLPQRFIAADPETFFGSFFDIWSHDPQTVPAEVREQYLATLRTRPAVEAICADYRAGAFVDPAHDAADRDRGRQLEMPVLAVWEDPGEVELPFDPQAVWSAWATDLRTLVVPGGHFLPEAQPIRVARAIADLVAGGKPDRRPEKRTRS